MEDEYRDEDIIPPTSTDLIGDFEWEGFLYKLVTFLNKHEKAFDVIDFLAQVKMKVEDCSRCYTAMWSLDMIHNAVRDNPDKFTETFKNDLNDLQVEWDKIMDRIRPQRKELIGEKCIENFFNLYTEHSKVATREEVAKLADNNHDRWYALCKLCNEKGLNSTKPYQDFVGKLMVLMAKY